jgi:hypothetical protein
MRRGCAALLVAMMALLTGVPADCAGWQATAQGRMDCCSRQNHDCPDQAAADNCCSRSEERQQQRSGVQQFVLPVPATAAFFLLSTLNSPTLESSVLSFESRMDDRPQRPTYLLTSALLI